MRDGRGPKPEVPAFFVSMRGTRLLSGHVREAFRDLRRRAGLTAVPGGRAPRVHDLRHSFAVATLVDWYRADADVAALLPQVVELRRARRPRSHLLLPAGDPRSARAGRRAPASESRSGHDAARADAFSPSSPRGSSRSDAPALTPSPATAIAFGCFWALRRSAWEAGRPRSPRVEDLDAASVRQQVPRPPRDGDRGNTARSRNVRLAALHSFFRYVAMNWGARVALHWASASSPSPQQAVRPQIRGGVPPRRGRYRRLAEGPRSHTVGSAAATGPFCWWRPRPGCAYRSSSACAVKTSA